MTPANVTKRPSHLGSFALLVGLNVAFFALTQFPIANLLLVPLNLLVTTLHELGHALACLATGGSVAAMTIVSDGDGHAGVTWTQGGWPLLITQAGYLGAAFFGCILIWLGRNQENAKNVLKGLGVLIGLAAIFLVGPGLLHGVNTTQALGSLGVCLAMSVALFFIGAKASPRISYFLLLIIAGQTALNALRDTFYLATVSLGLVPVNTSFTDATNMAKLTNIPAAFWSVLWGVISLAMLGLTLKLCYGSKKSKAGA